MALYRSAGYMHLTRAKNCNFYQYCGKWRELEPLSRRVFELDCREGSKQSFISVIFEAAWSVEVTRKALHPGNGPWRQVYLQQ